MMMMMNFTFDSPTAFTARRNMRSFGRQTPLICVLYAYINQSVNKNVHFAYFVFYL